MTLGRIDVREGVKCQTGWTWPDRICSGVVVSVCACVRERVGIWRAAVCRDKHLSVSACGLCNLRSCHAYPCRILLGIYVLSVKKNGQLEPRTKSGVVWFGGVGRGGVGVRWDGVGVGRGGGWGWGWGLGEAGLGWVGCG